MEGGIAYTKNFTATSESQMILGKDGNRLELTIFNISDTEFIYIGFGTEHSTFTVTNTLPLAPGESYDASVPPLSAVYLMTDAGPVDTVVYYSTKSPSYVKGLLS
jgi:hypothetical protein